MLTTTVVAVEHLAITSVHWIAQGHARAQALPTLAREAVSVLREVISAVAVVAVEHLAICCIHRIAHGHA